MTSTETQSSASTPPDNIQVIQTIADHLDTDPIETNLTFGEYVDLDALEALLESGTDELVIRFTVESMIVTVTNDGSVTVTDS